MQRLTIEASSLTVATGLMNALAEFRPESTAKEFGRYQVSVDLASSDEQIIAVLNALEEHVSERNDGPARVELNGHSYTMHAVPEFASPVH
jgi:hypothetical protein